MSKDEGARLSDAEWEIIRPTLFTEFNPAAVRMIINYVLADRTPAPLSDAQAKQRTVFIGDLRAWLLVPFDCKWNAMVRNVTAEHEETGSFVEPLAVFKHLVSNIRQNGHLDHSFGGNRLRSLFNEQPEAMPPTPTPPEPTGPTHREGAAEQPVEVRDTRACPNCGRIDGWHKAEGHPPAPIGDCRKIVWMRDRDGMEWWGVRAYNFAEGAWYSGSVEESASVRFWMEGPHNPEYAPLPLTPSADPTPRIKHPVERKGKYAFVPPSGAWD